MKKHSLVWTLTYSFVLVGYVAFTLLDAFVIPHDTVSISSVEASSESTATSESGTTTVNTDTSEAVVTDTSYSADGITVTLTTEYVHDTYVYIADVVIDDVSLLQSGLAEDSFGRNITEKTSEIAERLSAILAINGDYYGFRDDGYVIRNGYLYRDEASEDEDQEDLVIFEDGTFEIVNESEVTAQELLDAGATQVYSFGPALVNNGEIQVDSNDEVDQSMTSNPRTAIGMVEQGHYVFVVSDGRTSESEGLTLEELAEVMADAGCTVAYNLDGGGSSTMYFNGEVVNNPTTNGNHIKERSVSDIVFIG